MFLYLLGTECHSRFSNYVAGWTVRGSSPDRSERLFFSKTSLFRGQHRLLYKRYCGSFRIIKRPGREVNHSSPSGVDVKNEWIYTFPSLHTPSRRGRGRLCFTFISWAFTPAQFNSPRLCLQQEWPVSVEQETMFYLFYVHDTGFLTSELFKTKRRDKLSGTANMRTALSISIPE
jgi:hypothetical protein